MHIEAQHIKAKLATHGWAWLAQVHPCDKRRPIHEIKEQFPGVNFSTISTDEDVLWKADERETAEHIKVCMGVLA